MPRQAMRVFVESVLRFGMSSTQLAFPLVGQWANCVHPVKQNELGHGDFLEISLCYSYYVIIYI